MRSAWPAEPVIVLPPPSTPHDEAAEFGQASIDMCWRREGGFRPGLYLDRPRDRRTNEKEARGNGVRLN
jgi:hypothetical protein